MSVATSTSTISYTGNNSAVTPYSVPFPFFDSSDLVVVKKLTATGEETALALSADYTVDGAGDSEGGSVVTAVAIPPTYTLTIYREIPITQPTSYITADDFPAASHERALDRLTYLSQQNARKLDASFRFRESDGSANRFEKILSALIGVGADGLVTMFTGAQIQALLNLPATVIDQPTKTFANAAARVAATPDFLGQVGVQLDTFTIYTGTSIASGGWTVYSFAVSSGSVATSNLADAAVTNAKIAAGAVGSTKIAGETIHGQTLVTTLADADECLWYKASDGSLQRITKESLTGLFQPVGSVIQTVLAKGSATMQTIALADAAMLYFPAPSNVTPVVTKGVSILSDSFTTSASANKVLVSVDIPVFSCSSYGAVFALFRGSTCIGASVQYPGAGYGGAAHFTVLDSPGSAGTFAYSLRASNSGSSCTLNINGIAGGSCFGGIAPPTIMLQEIKG